MKIDNGSFLFTLALLLSLFVMLSCTDDKQEIRSFSERFVNSYIRADYDGVSRFCTDSLASAIKPRMSQIDSADNSLKMYIEKRAEESSVEILSVKKNENKGFVVKYKISSSAAPSGLEYVLQVSKIGDSLKVSKLGK